MDELCSAEPPLHGLRVLELAEGIAGPYAGRLLAMLGATVVKVEPDGGDVARTLTVDGKEEVAPCSAFIHLNAGKRNVSRAALATEDALTAAIRWAQVVIDDRIAEVAESSPTSPARTRRDNPSAVHLSVTPWGYRSDESLAPPGEVLVQAVSGALTTTTDPDAGPLRLPGWQSQYLAGAYGALTAVVAHRGGGGIHVDVPWVWAMATGCEGSFQVHLATGYEAPPAGPMLLQSFPGGALRCRDGHVVVGTVRRVDWERQCEIYGMPELAVDERFASREGRAKNWRDLLPLIQPWYDRHTRQEIFDAGLAAGWAVGKVLEATDTLDDPHLAERGFLGAVSTPTGTVFAPVTPFRAAGLPVADQGLRSTGADDDWFADQRPSPPPATKPVPDRGRPGGALGMDGVRVLDLTTAWAGPFVGRFLGGLGADVVKVESANAFDIWRGPAPFRLYGVTAPDGVDPSTPAHDISPNFNALNRNKRGISLDLSHPEGRAAFLRLVEHADVVVANFTERVLPALRLDEEYLRKARPDLVFLNMPALGATGPSKGAAGYGSIIEGMGGFAARFGTGAERARVSQTYYPDAVAGVHATLAVVAALAHRDRTGGGLTLDLSQQETLWMQLGESIVLAAREGRDPERLGNADPGAPGDIEQTESGWVARAGGRLEPVLRYSAAKADRRVKDLLETVDHPLTGSLPHLRLPLLADGQPMVTRRRAPRLGEHTAEVLRDWVGMDDDEVERLRRSGAADASPRMTSSV